MTIIKNYLARQLFSLPSVYRIKDMCSYWDGISCPGFYKLTLLLILGVVIVGEEFVGPVGALRPKQHARVSHIAHIQSVITDEHRNTA